MRRLAPSLMRIAPETSRVTRREAVAILAAAPLIVAGAREPKANLEALRSAALFAMDFG